MFDDEKQYESNEINDDFENNGIWEEPEHLLDPNELYGSDEMYDKSQSFSIFYKPESKTAFGMQLKDGKLLEAGKLILRGDNVRLVSKKVNICYGTILKLYLIILAQNYKNTGKRLWCDCGKEFNHPGQCWHRKKKKSKNTVLQYGHIIIQPNVKILECGCFIDKIVGARIVDCGRDDCCFDNGI